MTRCVAAVWIVWSMASVVAAQQPVLISGSADGQTLYGQVPAALGRMPSLGNFPVTIGGLILNSSDPMASTWLSVQRPLMSNTVEHDYPDGGVNQSFTLGGGNVLFGGNVPQSWRTALMGTFEFDEPTKPSPVGSNGTPVLTVKVTPPSESAVAEVSYAVTTADGNDTLYSGSAPLETGGWWILGLSPEGSEIRTTDGLPYEDGIILKNVDPTPEERETFGGEPPPPVPEPGTLASAGFGLACAALRLRRK